MDFFKQATGGGDNKEQNQNQGQGENKEQGGGGFLGGIGDKINSAAGGGKESEKNEDYLDKGQSPPSTSNRPLADTIPQGVDAFQQHVLGQGDQSNESAVEQAKDEKISDFIRDKYKSSTGNEVPIKDKETRFG